MHPINGSLERFKVSGYRHDVLVESRDLGLLQLEITIDEGLLCLGSNKSIERRHVELVSNLVHSQVRRHELLLELRQHRLVTLLDLTLKLGFVHFHIRQQVIYLLIPDFFRYLQLECLLVDLLIDEDLELIKPRLLL